MTKPPRPETPEEAVARILYQTGKKEKKRMDAITRSCQGKHVDHGTGVQGTSWRRRV